MAVVKNDYLNRGQFVLSLLDHSGPLPRVGGGWQVGRVVRSRGGVSE